MRKRMTATILAFAIVFSFAIGVLPQVATTGWAPPELTQEQAAQAIRVDGIMAEPLTLPGRETVTFTIEATDVATAQEVQYTVHRWTAIADGNEFPDGSIVGHVFRLTPSEAINELGSFERFNVRVNIPGISSSGAYRVLHVDASFDGWQGGIGAIAGNGYVDLNMRSFEESSRIIAIVVPGPAAAGGGQAAAEDYEPPQTQYTPQTLSGDRLYAVTSLGGISARPSTFGGQTVNFNISSASETLANAAQRQLIFGAVVGGHAEDGATQLLRVFRITPADGRTDFPGGINLVIEVPGVVAGRNYYAMHSTDGATWNSVPIRGGNGTVTVTFTSFSYLAIIELSGSAPTPAAAAEIRSPQTGQ